MFDVREQFVRDQEKTATITEEWSVFSSKIFLNNFVEQSNWFGEPNLDILRDTQYAMTDGIEIPSFITLFKKITLASRDGAVVTALTSHQCAPLQVRPQPGATYVLISCRLY